MAMEKIVTAKFLKNIICSLCCLPVLAAAEDAPQNAFGLNITQDKQMVEVEPYYQGYAPQGDYRYKVVLSQFDPRGNALASSQSGKFVIKSDMKKDASVVLSHMRFNFDPNARCELALEVKQNGQKVFKQTYSCSAI